MLPGLYLVTGPNGSGKSHEARRLAEITPGARLLSAETQQAFYERELAEDESNFRGGADLGRTVRQLLGDAGVAHPLCRAFRLDGLLARGYRQLSTGESRKVLLLRALLEQPSLLVFDEPFEGLDHAACGELRHALEHLAERMPVVVAGTFSPTHPDTARLLPLHLLREVTLLGAHGGHGVPRQRGRMAGPRGGSDHLPTRAARGRRPVARDRPALFTRHTADHLVERTHRVWRAGGLRRAEPHRARRRAHVDRGSQRIRQVQPAGAVHGRPPAGLCQRPHAVRAPPRHRRERLGHQAQRGPGERPTAPRLPRQRQCGDRADERPVRQHRPLRDPGASRAHSGPPLARLAGPRAAPGRRLPRAVVRRAAAGAGGARRHQGAAPGGAGRAHGGARRRQPCPTSWRWWARCVRRRRAPCFS
jgi:hypothetical protein